jgi:hypothetical protein
MKPWLPQGRARCLARSAAAAAGGCPGLDAQVTRITASNLPRLRALQNRVAATMALTASYRSRKIENRCAFVPLGLPPATIGPENGPGSPVLPPEETEETRTRTDSIQSQRPTLSHQVSQAASRT